MRKIIIKNISDTLLWSSDYTLAMALQLPGYQQYCRHQHEIEHKVKTWCRAVENYYCPVGSRPKVILVAKYCLTCCGLHQLDKLRGPGSGLRNTAKPVVKTLEIDRGRYHQMLQMGLG